MNKILTPIFIVIFHITLFGQSQYTLIGKVINQDSISIPNLKVVILGANNDFKNYAFTKEDGSFNFNLAKGHYLLKIEDSEKLLLKTKVLVNANKDLGTLIVAERIESLSEVVIMGTKKAVTSSNKGINLNVKGTELENKGSALDVLQYAPNITDGYKVLGSSNIVIVLNGNELHLNKDQIPTFLSSLKSENIKSIEVIDRPDPSVGTNKDAIIKIEMDYKRGLSGSVHSGYFYNGHSGYSSGADLFFGNKHSRIWTSVYKEGHKSIFDENGRTKSNDFENNYIRNGDLNRSAQGVTLGYEYKFKKSNISLLYDYMDDEDNDYKIITRSNLKQNQINYFTINRRDFEHIYKIHTISLNFQNRIDTIGSNISLNSEYGHRNYNIPFKQTDSIFQSGNLTGTNAFEQSEKDVISFFFTKFTYEKFDKNKNRLKMGIQYTNDNNNYFHNYLSGYNLQQDNDNHFLFRESNFSFFTTYKKKIKKSNLNLGFTLEKTLYKFNNANTPTTNKEYYSFSPYLLYYKKFKNNSAYIYLTKKIYRPKYNLFDNTLQISDQINASKGNSDLKPIEQYIVQSGFTWKKKYNFILKYYFVNNSILYRSEFDQNINRLVMYPTNEGSSHNILSVISIPVKFSKKIKFTNNLNLYFSDYKYTNGSSQSAYFNLSINGDFTLPKNISCGLSIYYTSPYKYYKTTYRHSFSTSLNFNIPISDSFNIHLEINDIFNTSKTQSTYIQDDIMRFSDIKYKSQSVVFGLIYKFSKGKKIDKSTKESEFEDEENRSSK